MKSFSILAAALLISSNVALAEGEAGVKALTGTRSVQVFRAMVDGSISEAKAFDTYGVAGTRLFNAAQGFKKHNALSDAQWAELAEKAADRSPEAVANMFQAASTDLTATTPSAILALGNGDGARETGGMGSKYRMRNGVPAPRTAVGDQAAEIVITEGPATIAGASVASMVPAKLFRKARVSPDALPAKNSILKTADENSAYAANVTRVDSDQMTTYGTMMQAAADANCSVACRKFALASVYQYMRLGVIVNAGQKAVDFALSLYRGKLVDTKLGITMEHLTEGLNNHLEKAKTLLHLPKGVHACVTTGQAPAMAY